MIESGPLAGAGGDSHLPGAESAAEHSAGALLRQARERAAVSVETLADAMKVPVQKIQALEADRLDQLPDLTFARALAATICRAFEIDPAPVLAKLPHTKKAPLPDRNTSINTPFGASSRSGVGGSASTLSRPAIAGGLALALAALLLYLYPVAKRALDESKLGATASTGSSTARAPVADAPAAGEPPTTFHDNLPMPAHAADPASGKVAAGAPPGANLSVTSTQPAASVSGVAGPGASGLATAVAADILTFEARSGAWVQVTDGKGRVVLRRTLAPGEVATATGVPPLAAVVGRADSTLVRVRGQPLDLSGSTKNNIARFEVK